MNIRKDDCSSYPIPPAPTIPSIVAILTFLSSMYKLFPTNEGKICGIIAKLITCNLEAFIEVIASAGPGSTCSIASA